jgi:hypothetical protein
MSSLCRKSKDELLSKRGALVILRDILGIPLGEPVPGENMGHLPPTSFEEAPGVGVAEGVVVEKFDDT